MLRLWTLTLPAREPQNHPAAFQDAHTSYEHAQQAITRVDAKASLVTTIQAAALGALLTLPARPVGAGRSLYTLGASLLLIALALAGAVVYPRLPRGATTDADDALWFGQLRHWHPDKLADHLARRTPDARLRGLARQLVTVSRLSWRKHRLLQASLLTALAGAAALTAAYLI